MSGYRAHPSNPFLEFKKEDVEQSISSRFEKMVEMYPDRVAVKDQNETFTYAELNKFANSIAEAIQTQIGAEENEPVSLLLGHHAHMIGAVLGVLKAGKCYVPLNPTIPRERLRHILEESGANLIVTDSRYFSQAGKLAQEGFRIVQVEACVPPALDSSVRDVSAPNSPAWIIYTSGSTGKPKGVVESQRNLLHTIMNYTNEFHINPEDRILLSYSYAFGASTRSIFGALLNGASVVLFDFWKDGFENLPRFLRRERITLIHLSVSLFRNLCRTLEKKDFFPDLRFIYTGNEPVKKSDVDLYRTHFSPSTLFVITYATTESSTIAHHFIDHSTEISSEGLHVGYPLPDKEVILLDEDGSEASSGGSGEIAVRSEFLFLEYWKQSELTRAVLQPDPEGRSKRIYRTGDLGRFGSDGGLYHLGRKDFQVKVRGFRVEIGEVETRLLELDGVKEVAVHGQEDSSGESRLVAYIVSSGESSPKVSRLRQELSQHLPAYMIPAAFVMLETLPLTPTGKLDRRALPNPGDRRPDLDASFVAPRGPIEEELAHIWSRLLGFEPVGVNDPFLELGGDSLLATQLISRVREKFNVDFSITSMLLTAPTVAEMATAIVDYLANQIGHDELERLMADLKGPSDDGIA